MIASITFRNFRALRNTQLSLSPFNLVIGPNGSGKTSLIDAILRLRSLAKLPLRDPSEEPTVSPFESPKITFSFDAPFETMEAELECVSDLTCDLLKVSPMTDAWPVLRGQIGRMRNFIFDHHAMAAHPLSREGADLTTTGGNLAAVLYRLSRLGPEVFGPMEADLVRILPEYSAVVCALSADGTAMVGLTLAATGELIAAENLSQGTLYLLGLLSLTHDPHPPSLLAIEELDRGFHPRMLREVRDLLYRLSHPESVGLKRPPVQIIATTHSPFLLDTFRDHPEEIVISSKTGALASFARLADLPDMQAILEGEGTLGDLWYAGVLGGVPQEGKGPS